VGHGAAAFSELFGGMMCAVKRVAHHLDTMLFIEQGNCVAAEGTTEGTDVHGVEWHGGRTRGGRFCSIFLFGQSGLIERLHIYMIQTVPADTKKASCGPSDRLTAGSS
jgi:hypothetical protein